MEEFALQSHRAHWPRSRPAGSATRSCRWGSSRWTRAPGADTSLEKMAALQPLREGGRVTAALAIQISDGASAVLVASEDAVQRFGLTPRARVHHISVRGDDPVYMLTAPIRATRYALDRAGMTIDDIDLIEINEAFASVVLAWLQELKADPAASTSTAARSHWVTRSAPPARN